MSGNDFSMSVSGQKAGDVPVKSLDDSMSEGMLASSSGVSISTEVS